MDSELKHKEDFLKCRKNNNLQLSTSPLKTNDVKIAIICVPTPIPDVNTFSDVFVTTAVQDFLNHGNLGDIIILESSIEVGTTEKIKEII